jgi:AcrR family transcriptional regulator
MPKQVDHDAYRKDLARRAFPAFASKGYAALGVRELADELEISKSAFYHYFPSKAALYAAVCAYVIETDIESLRVFLEQRRRREASTVAFFRWVAANEGWLLRELGLLVDAEKHREAFELQRGATDAYVEALSTLLDLEPAAALKLFDLANGLLFRRLVDGGPVDYVEAGRWLTDALASAPPATRRPGRASSGKR